MLRTFKVLLLVLSFSLFSHGQKGTHTPYSSFGIGELKGNDYAPFLSMGGVSMAGSDSTILNQQNPASYSYIGRYRPIFQIGLNGRLSRFKTDTDLKNQRHFGLNQFQFGVPIKKRWGAAIGLKPYSFTGYQISDYTVEDGDSTALFTNEGKGGVNNFFFGFGYRPIHKWNEKNVAKNRKDSTGVYVDTFNVYREHNLSFGANGNFLFGSSSKISTYQTWINTQGLNSRVNNSLRFSGLVYDLGVNYLFKFKSKSSDRSEQHANAISIGASYSPRIAVKAFQDILAYSYINGGVFNGPETIADTIENITDNQGKVIIPESYKFGFEYRIGPKNTQQSSLVRIGVDARYQKWSAYSEDFGTVYSNNMNDRLNVALGLEWTPAAIPDVRTPFLSKVHYRMGVNYTMTELKVLNNLNNYTDLTSYGMSFGVGFPITIIKNSNTNVNFGANLGKLGTTENGLIQEKYVGLFFGLSITPGNGDLWFIKRKYD
jgi:hypothetical protein